MKSSRKASDPAYLKIRKKDGTLTFVKREKQYRSQSHGYSVGSYFVTICTGDRICWFGDVVNEEMKLSEIGSIVKENWEKIPDQFEGVSLGEFIVMPNHVHGVINIGATKKNMIYHDLTGDVLTAENRRSTDNYSIPRNPMKNPEVTLGRIIRWFKGKSTFEIRRDQKDKDLTNQVPTEFKWHSRYHDSTIRDQNSMANIERHYCPGKNLARV